MIMTMMMMLMMIWLMLTFWAAYVPCEAQHRDAVQLTLEQIDVIKRLTDRYSPQLTTCTSAQDIIDAHKNQQLCSLTGVEGGHSLGGSLAVLRTLYAIGVRYMTLTSTCHTPWADSSYADAPTFNMKHGGLTIFGKYTEWYSHSCPFSNALLEFRRRVRLVVGNIIKDEDDMRGPILVHCSDGGGRSGVYMSIDANLELAEEEECFNVFGYLKKLRQSRKGLVENVEQYKFIYDTLEEHIICGKTWFPVSELSDRLKAKARRNSGTKMNEYQAEYDQICKQTPRFTIGDCAGGHRADNREKNRDVLCVPPDNFRPYLTSFQGNAFTDYINSVFVDGYTKPREYIVTEWPMKHTLGEFWSLVYDQECSAVVVLCQPPSQSQQYPSFWPNKSKMEKYGPVFSVHYVMSKSYTNIKQWEFKINKKIVSLTEMMAGVKAPTRTVQLFQLTCWPMGHKVPSSTNSLVYLMNMVEIWRNKVDYGPVCVVSPDGRSRAGVYCAANACIEQVIQHGEVDVFQAVKTVRRHRPQLVENMTEYKYCYDLVLHYVLHFLNKKE
ncbi:GM17096 [Drosophila sechellia]|uniref:GM17096 n=1 Tax=Drosophila sechellia TaxID=7238 RepID=B4I5F7_DROSE|nr:GM17096 [Drosophila sechellia]